MMGSGVGAQTEAGQPRLAVRRWEAYAEEPRAADAIAAICLDNSGRTFPDACAREAFAERWALRYLRTRAQSCFVLTNTTDERILGYLVGSPDTPMAPGALCAEHEHLTAFRHEIDAAPAHLHINLRPAVRGRGHGRALVERFALWCRERGVATMHVVTAADAANIAFYENIGFTPHAQRAWNNRPLILLDRACTAPNEMLSDTP